MAEHSRIEWTEATWNPVTGCTLVSEGCRHCYAAKLAATRLKNHPSRKGLARRNAAGEYKFTGEVRFNEVWLDQPLRWTRPRMIFVCAHGDLFHEDVPDEWIDRVFAVMALSPRHTFQVLTKRPERMRAYFESDPQDRWNAEAGVLVHWDDMPQREPGPLSNVWLGVSVEDQATADERIPYLLATPAAVRFVSYEPALGPVDFDYIETATHLYAALIGQTCERVPQGTPGSKDGLKVTNPFGPRLDQVIVGGESGPGARPAHPDWFRSARDQCAAAGVAFFFKQWGAWAPLLHSEGADEAGWQGRGDWMILSHDGDMDIPDYRWPDEAAGEVAIIRVGKKAAGALLDGREHREFPKVAEPEAA